MIENILDDTITAMRSMKQFWVTHHPGDPDLPVLAAAVYRGDELVARYYHPITDAHGPIPYARVACTGFCATTLAIFTETWEPGPDYPDTYPGDGRPWDQIMAIPGELSRIDARDGALAKGWIQEGLVASVVDRDGGTALSFDGFTLSADRTTVEWTYSHRTVNNDRGRAAEGMFDALRGAIQAPTIIDVMDRFGQIPGTPTDPADRTTALDGMTMQTLTSLGALCALSSRADDVARMQGILAMFPGGDVVAPGFDPDDLLPKDEDPET